MPDLGLTTADDMVRNAAMLAGLDRDVPVIADADTGFGGPVMVERTVSGSRGLAGWICGSGSGWPSNSLPPTLQSRLWGFRAVRNG